MSAHQYPKSVRKLANELSRLPTIGEKTASRLAYHLVTEGSQLSTTLARSLSDAVAAVKLCNSCFFLTEQERCSICEDSSRDSSLLCVVERPADVLAIERTGRYSGLYHVLHGLWSPARPASEGQLKLDELFLKLGREQGQSQPEEVLIATGTTVEGDATALYIANVLTDRGIRSSRLAQGMPMGGELEYADEITLTHAIQGRKEL